MGGDVQNLTIGPQPGPQMAMLSCPAQEILYGGSRGGGKSYALLLDWCAHNHKYGRAARGIMFRKTMPELEDIIQKGHEIYPHFGGVYRTQAKTWHFPGAGTLKFRFLDKDSDADKYQGHSYTWMAFDEVGNWPSPAPLDKLRACLRSAENVRHRYLMTSNPGGPGHCVPYGDVWTPTGWRDIKELKVGDVVWTVNSEGRIVHAFIEQYHKSYYEGPMSTFRFKRAFIECTPNHTVHTTEGPIKFEDLTNKNTVRCFNEDFSPLNVRYKKLKGVYKSPTVYFRGFVYCLGIPDTHCFILDQGGLPWLSGNSWVKSRYIDVCPPMKIVKDGDWGKVFIPAKVSDNQILLKSDPTYIDRLKQSGPEWLVKAWLDGDWDIVAGGAFDDLWHSEVHRVKPFLIPDTWRIDRSFDWGSTAPYAVLYFAESDGSTVPGLRYHPRGTIFQIAELYGWGGAPNVGCKKLASELAQEIMTYEYVTFPGRTVYPGAADSSIWTRDDGLSIAETMEKIGVYWEVADKSPGSRKSGFEEIRRRLKAGLSNPMEEPGLFFFENCIHSLRTIPTLPRDPRNYDDIDTSAEDHCCDALRYRLRRKVYEARVGGVPTF